MRLDDRKEHILDFIIRDYIETAQPVSSGKMASRNVLNSSPATLRNLMLELDEDGFLYQPHTSAGRAPTEKGYRYFIDNLIEFSGAQAPGAKTRKGDRHFGFLANNLANELGVFVSLISKQNRVREFSGFHGIFSEPEFREEKMLEDFGKMVDEIEDVAARYSEALLEDDDLLNVWIGSENIYPGARSGSSIVSRIELPEGEFTIFAFGPTRMDYEKAISKIRNLIENI